MRVSHILVQNKYEAEDLARKLKEGADFAVLAHKFSLCSSAKLGGDLGEVAASKLDPDFREAAEALKPGEVSGPIRTRFGHHLILRA